MGGRPVGPPDIKGAFNFYPSRSDGWTIKRPVSGTPNGGLGTGGVKRTLGEAGLVVEWIEREGNRGV